MKTTDTRSPSRMLSALCAMLMSSAGALPPASAANIECKPTVKVTNEKGASIKVLRFEYTVLGKAHKEGLANKRLAPNETEEWKSQKLQHAATGLVITSTRVEYKDDNSGAGDGYGPAKWSPAFPHSFTCNDNHNYIHVIG